ncbi:MAG: hypothetical protein K8W52_06720 [Deltaproteobacteria bacterium]|nr:hypothetical protein [Deltaproteobacteria bacterium]
MARRRQPSYFFAALPMLLGIAAAVAFGVRLYTGVRDMERIVVPGERDLTLDAGDYVGFLESSSVVDGVSYSTRSFSGSCNLASAAGDAIRLDSPSGSTTYSFGSYAGQSSFAFTIPTSGTYHLACTGEKPSAVIAIGQGVGMGIVAILLAGFGGAVLSVVVFLLIYRRNKRA